ncbi:MAG: glycosyltransferase family 2 protein [Candidatus Gastranaerophilaceae bacterium]
MKISVIIPVYNVAEYLTKCLDSVVNQTLKDIEIICVNDGSVDNSLEILKAYAQQDNRIVIIDKQNEGVAVARNDALDIAKGDYIMFLDSDDYLTLDACETAYSKITSENADIGVFSHIEAENGICTEAPKNKVVCKYAQDENLTDYSCFQIMSCDKIYKNSFLNNNNLRFPKGIKNAEDGVFSWYCLFNSPKYCFIEKPIYIYVVNRQNSATNEYENCIKNNNAAFITMFDAQIFKKQPIETQLTIISHFCNGARWYWDNFYKFYQRKVLIKDIREFLSFLEEHYDKKDLMTLKKYRVLKNIYWYTFMNTLFSMVNSRSKSHKIITILGIKIKYKRKKLK